MSAGVPGWDEATNAAARAAGVDVDRLASTVTDRKQRESLISERDAAIAVDRTRTAAVTEAARLYLEEGLTGAELAVALEQNYGREAATMFVDRVWAPAEEPAPSIADATPSQYRAAIAAVSEQAETRRLQAEQEETARRTKAIEAELHRLPRGAELEPVILDHLRSVDPDVIRTNPEAAVMAAYKVAATQVEIGEDAIFHARESQPFRSTRLKEARTAGLSLQEKDGPPDRNTVELQRELELDQRTAALHAREAAAALEARLAPARTAVEEQAAAVERFTAARDRWDDGFVKKGERSAAAVGERFERSLDRRSAFSHASAAAEIEARGGSVRYPGSGSDAYPSFQEREAAAAEREQTWTQAQELIGKEAAA